MTTSTMTEQLRDWANLLDDNTVGGLALQQNIAGVVAGLRAVADDIERTPQPVWVLEVTHKHGADITVHATQQSARAALTGYCLDWWDTVFQEEDAVDPETLTEDQVITQYFEAVSEYESFEIFSAQVQP